MSGSRLRVEKIAFSASFVHRHTVFGTGCKLRGQEGVRLYSLKHLDSRRSAPQIENLPSTAR